MTQEMTNALDNLASAAVSKKETMNKLALTNKQFTKTISILSKENEKLLQIIKKLITGTRPIKCTQL